MTAEWSWRPLSELYEFSSGLSKPRSEFGHGYGFLTFKDVLDNYVVPNQLTALVNSTDKERQSCSVMRGDVFLTRTSETQEELGMSCVALRDYDSATFNGFTKRLRPKDHATVVPEYAAYFFRSRQFTPSIDTAQAIAVMQEKHDIVCGILHGFDWQISVGDPKKSLLILPSVQEHILQQQDGKQRFMQVVTDLSRAFALCAATDAAIELRDDIAFFQAVRSHLAKTSGSQRPPEELDAAVRQLVAGAIMADEGIIDVFAAAGLKRPDISILSDQFLAEVRGLKHKNVAAELLAKLLKDEIKLRSARNIVQSRQFSEMLKATLNAYHNRAIATQEVIEELIKLAKEMSAATSRGVDLGLNEDEVAFYDALAANESAVQAMGNDELKVIAAELVTKVRKSVTIDWTLRESARARIRVMVKRILKKHGYPPDLQDEATKTVLAQAELLSAGWTH